MNQNNRNRSGSYSRALQGNPRPSGQRPPQKRRKKKIRFTPNKEGMIALAILLLGAALIIALLIFTIKGIVSLVGGADETTTTESTPAESTTDPIVAAKWYDDYVKEAIPSADVAAGELILVNFENKYDLTDTFSTKLKSLYNEKGYGQYFVLKDSELKIRRDIVEPLRQMLTALVDNSTTLGTTKEHDRVIIVSGHRSTEYQQGLYNNAVEDNYVAVPGHSEHHSGYAVDLKVFTSGGKTVEFREDEQAWMEANCADYGFIVRYDGAKFELTGILDETWHFRYVGKPHAQYMTENGLCMEEYLAFIREHYSIETCDAPLSYTTGEGEEAQEYEIYYVPASLDTTTDIPVPKKDDVKDIAISGDNMGGFIVTVTK